ncbi:MAG: sensor domain-containing diguanylate cyclase [Spirochaetes bacterium]|nr:sensor domain-containing diguanylate cyclase [Spirochaetota bacterium]MBU1078974.1 sensor domain-containing diguanylate cyclase [Spirochaetota bacterium]
MEELPRTGIGEKGRLIATITLLLVVGFVGTSLFAFFSARNSVRASIERDSLPSAADYVYSSLQKALVEPIFVSSMMANDTFLHDWATRGERDPEEVIAYLSEIRNRYAAFTTFFVSEGSSRYYQADGVLKSVSPGEPRDEWYYRVRGMADPYEINLDRDMAHGDALTIFINYRVLDRSGAFLGVAGVGISIDSMNGLIETLGREHDTAAYFVDGAGRIVSGAPYGTSIEPASAGAAATVAGDAALRATAEAAMAAGGGSFRYRRPSGERLLYVRYLPELGWYLFVEGTESSSMAEARRALWLSLAAFAFIMVAVIALVAVTIDRYQSRLERTASYDQLTGALNRMSFAVLCDHAVKESRRSGSPLSVAIFDVDDFKRVNDRHGHAAGDKALRLVVAGGQSGLRLCDPLCRWGGEEFVALLASCDEAGAVIAAEKFRSSAASLCAAEGPSPVTLSAGVATLKPDETFYALVGRADEALLSAKQAGKDRIEAARA